MRILMSILMILMIASPGWSADHGLLEEIGKPELMEISGDYLFLVEGATLYQYNLRDFSFVRSFGQKGEGPGELKVVPSIVNYLIPLEESIFFVSLDKAIEFSHEGKVIREFRIPQFTNYLYPLENGFLTMLFKTGEERSPDMQVCLVDPDFKVQKILYSQKMSGGQNMINLTFDGVNITFTSGGFYVDRSPDGFVISRFSPQGIPSGEIRKPFPPIPFTSAHEKAAIERIKNNPEIKRVGWENIRSALKITHSDYFPLIQDLTSDHGNIWVMTAEQKENKTRFLKIDPEGRILKKIFLPTPMDSGFTNQLFGRPARFFKFHNEKYYYLTENEDEDCWEVLSVAL